MRIKRIVANNVAPINLFDVSDLTDLVVVAGANGVGKTRLIKGIIASLQQPQGANVSFEVEATENAEFQAWGKKIINTLNPNDARLFMTVLQQNQKRKNFKSSILYYESNRQIQQVKPYAFTWDVPDPYEENVSWNTTFSGLTGRFQDTQHAIFKKIQNQKNQIAAQALNLKKQGHSSMNLNFEDPLIPFKEAFHLLLGPKKLEDADIRNQILNYSLGGEIRQISTLSSGENEVVKIVFDFILRSPSDCIVFFDEPELHLHPELSFKLINTLRSVGSNNQFILCSHNPDIISSSLNDTVIFLRPPKKENNVNLNQGVIVKDDDDTNLALKQLGHSVGIISLGRRIVLVEGKHSSLDKMVYGQIIKNKYSNLVLVPCEGKDGIITFSQIQDKILGKSLWGVDFFMLCDGDARVLADSNPNERLKFLKKYHLENYFLDEVVISEVFKDMEPEGSWLRDPKKVIDCIKDIAKEKISYAVALNISHFFRLQAGNVDLMVKGCDQFSKEKNIEAIIVKAKNEKERVCSVLDEKEIEAKSLSLYQKFEESFQNDDEYWKCNIPGKQVLNSFCSKAKIDPSRFRILYLKKAESTQSKVFQEIEQLFSHFSSHESAKEIVREVAGAEI